MPQNSESEGTGTDVRQLRRRHWRRHLLREVDLMDLTVSNLITRVLRRISLNEPKEEFDPLLKFVQGGKGGPRVMRSGTSHTLLGGAAGRRVVRDYNQHGPVYGSGDVLAYAANVVVIECRKDNDSWRLWYDGLGRLLTKDECINMLRALSHDARLRYSSLLNLSPRFSQQA